jgi:thiol-disulfide isomerase/thioredoxin
MRKSALHTKHFFALIIPLLVLIGCTSGPPKFKIGETWRSVLTNEADQQLPFNFDVVDGGNGKVALLIRNAEEKIVVDEVTFIEDSVFIKLPVFDTEFKGKLTQSGEIEGEWIKHYAKTTRSMPWKAWRNIQWRFSKTPDKPTANISGKWDITFIYDGKDTTKAIGEFTQNGAKLKGTILTATGDYRYLDGEVNGSKVSLSTFDGSHAFIFQADITENGELANGNFYSGTSYLENWTAVKDDSVSLPNAYDLTYIKEGFDSVFFTFPNLDNQLVSLSDEKYKDKVVLIQIMGSWCPNCMDETSFYADYFKNHKEEGLEIIALAYERSENFEKEKKNLERLIKRFGVEYDVLLAGLADKKKANETLPMLNHVLSFPTTIYIDKKGKVRRIHTGFSGPGTGHHYDEFVDKFEQFMQTLLNE